MPTVYATAPIRWAPYLCHNDPTGLLRGHTDAAQDRRDADQFLYWMRKYGRPVAYAPYQRTRNGRARDELGDHIEFAGAENPRQSKLARYQFIAPTPQTKAFKPAYA